jgi:hypothetical protein
MTTPIPYDTAPTRAQVAKLPFVGFSWVRHRPIFIAWRGQLFAHTSAQGIACLLETGRPEPTFIGSFLLN